uniref:Homeobox domain-containing protein n=1 Tax=Peromyscus maniculatus bairdii TaxID=230844 RepID=A0A8C8W5S8_PERMB
MAAAGSVALPQPSTSQNSFLCFAGTLASRCQRTVWKARQQYALLTAFSKNLYPSFRARQVLAREMGLPESHIPEWFQNCRNREQSRQHAHSARSLPEEGHTRLCTQLSSAQLTILLQAFEKDLCLKYASRMKLAQETGLPEIAIHIWYQNRRACHPGRGRGRVRVQDSLV